MLMFLFERYYFIWIPFGGNTILMQPPLHQTHSEEDAILPEEEDVEDAGTTLELPFLDTELGGQELDQALIIRQEEFVEVDRRDDMTDEELKDKKVAEKCLHCICEP